MTYVIPLELQAANRSQPRIFPDPAWLKTASASMAHTIAPFDDCGGHVNPHVGYHYHAGTAGSNTILGCLAAQAGCALEDDNAFCDASVHPPRP